MDRRLAAGDVLLRRTNRDQHPVHTIPVHPLRRRLSRPCRAAPRYGTDAPQPSHSGMSGDNAYRTLAGMCARIAVKAGMRRHRIHHRFEPTLDPAIQHVVVAALIVRLVGPGARCHRAWRRTRACRRRRYRPPSAIYVSSPKSLQLAANSLPPGQTHSPPARPAISAACDEGESRRGPPGSRSSGGVVAGVRHQSGFLNSPGAGGAGSGNLGIGRSGARWQPSLHLIGGDRALYRVLVKAVFHPAVELPADRPALRRGGADAHTRKVHVRVVEGIDAHHFQIGGDRILPARLRTHRAPPHLPQQLSHAIRLLIQPDRAGPTGRRRSPRVWLVTVVTEENGMMWTDPSSARSRIVRMDRYSTVPLNPPSETTSPTCIAFSSSRNSPVIRSCTSFCEPKPMATPSTPAPASSGGDVQADLAQYDQPGDDEDGDQQSRTLASAAACANRAAPGGLRRTGQAGDLVLHAGIRPPPTPQPPPARRCRRCRARRAAAPPNSPGDEPAERAEPPNLRAGPRPVVAEIRTISSRRTAG